MTVSIQEKKGKWYVVVSYKKENGQWATKWHKTGLVVKGNKKRVEAIASQIAKEYKDGLNLDNYWRVETFFAVLVRQCHQKCCRDHNLGKLWDNCTWTFDSLFFIP